METKYAHNSNTNQEIISLEKLGSLSISDVPLRHVVIPTVGHRTIAPVPHQVPDASDSRPLQVQDTDAELAQTVGEIVKGMVALLRSLLHILILLLLVLLPNAASDFRKLLLVLLVHLKQPWE